MYEAHAAIRKMDGGKWEEVGEILEADLWRSDTRSGRHGDYDRVPLNVAFATPRAITLRLPLFSLERDAPNLHFGLQASDRQCLDAAGPLTRRMRGLPKNFLRRLFPSG